MTPAVWLSILLAGCLDGAPADAGAAGTEVSDGTTPCATRFVDADGDGVGGDTPAACGEGVPTGGDCDDADPAVFPGAPEACDGVDGDCDGKVDEGLTRDLYPDLDGDGHGDDAAEPVLGCPEDGWSTLSDDCDDTDPAVHPQAEDPCDDFDSDCDGDNGLAGAAFAPSGGEAEAVDLALTEAGLSLDVPGTLYLCDLTLETHLDLAADVDVVGSGDVRLTALPGAPVVEVAPGVRGSVTRVDLVGSDVASGGAVWVGEGARMSLQSLSVQGGRAERGGGVWVGSGAILDVGDVVFRDVEASVSGGAIAAEGAEVHLAEVMFDGPVAGRGGAVSVVGGSLDAAHVSFISGEVSGAGGGVFAEAATVRIEDSAFTFGDAEAGGGLALVGGTASLRAVEFDDLHAEKGGALSAADDAEVSLTDCVFAGNSASEGGAAWVENARLSSSNGLWSANAAEDGGAVRAAATESARTTTLELRGDRVTGNGAARGGGLRVLGGGLVLDRVELDGGSATEVGGGVYLTSGATPVSGRCTDSVLRGSSPEDLAVDLGAGDTFTGLRCDVALLSAEGTRTTPPEDFSCDGAGCR